ncbi:MAG: hypothetical protein K6C10_11655 [Prevotella sp.]|nr:hypothetical protein [Prevotella sp.]
MRIACFVIVALFASTSAMRAQTATNLSSQSEVSASVDSEEHPLSLIKDNRTSANYYWSSNHGEEFYGQYEYVEMAWDRNNGFTNIRAYWALNEEEGVLLPTDAYVAWWNGHEWVKAATLAAPDETNLSETDVEMTSNRLRFYMKSEKACGLRELRVYGVRGEACKAAVIEDNSVVAWEEGKQIVLAPKVTLPDGEEETPIWLWTLPDGTTATTATIVATQAGQYKVTYLRQCGAETDFYYNVFDPSISYEWPEYSPTLNYDFRWEYPELSAPTKGRLPENVNVAKEVHGEWWSVAVGPKANPLITEESMRLLAQKMDEDFAYFRNEFGWPPDKRARNGYYSQVYGYGSGLSFDAGTPNTATGGWQSTTYYNGSSWPMVFLSYYPIYCFDPECTYGDRIGQQNACVHEGIHATFADLDGCKQSAWFHEGGNTWLQGEAELAKSGVAPTSMGYLSAGNMIAPFMPIECYSGWLLDDSFGGPSAEGVNMYNGSQQVCTWRNLLGGVQYGELFPHFLSEIMGRGAIPWIWRYCKTRVLEGMADSLGAKQMRHLIMEYRSRQALVDVGQWSMACRKLLDDNWLLNVQQEWSPYWKKVKVWQATPYANMYKCNEVDSLGWWYPEWRTTPGWSGANQIPLHVSGNKGDLISIHFKPLGKNMTCQLCFRTRRGRTYYSQPIEGEGDVVMKLQDVPANNVVFAVVCNTDYIYQGDATRKQHFDYRLKMGENVYMPGKAQLKWYDYKSTIKDQDFITAIEKPTEVAKAAEFRIEPERTVVGRGERLYMHIAAASKLQVPVRMFNQAGQMIYSQSFMRDGYFEIPADIVPGIYMLQGVNGKETSGVKIVVK